MQKRSCSSCAAFTLVELMVVVVLVALIASGIGAAALSQTHRAAASAGEGSSSLVALQQPPLRVSAHGDGGEALGPTLERVGIEVDLSSQPVIDGMRVEARFDARVLARFVLRQTDPRASRVRVEFPFPRGVSGVRDVSLRVGLHGARPTEARGAVYSPLGLAWEGALAPDASLDAVVSYSAQGVGAFACEISGGARVGAVTVIVRLSPDTHPRIAPDSLLPSTVSAAQLTWSYTNLVASRPMVLELPASESPLGRAALLCRLAALAVLLFGLGFWYLAELRGAGSLDGFRWGHFLLLTSNHVLFFVSFAVLGLWLFPPVAFALAAAPSLSLLTLHVARVTDRAFALFRALPLAALSFAVASAVAYAPAQRPLLALFTILGAAAYITVTWLPWCTGRARHEAALARSCARGLREQKLSKTFEALAEARAAGAVALEASVDPLSRAVPQGPRGVELSHAESALRRALDEESRVRSARGGLADADDETHDHRVRSLEARARSLSSDLVSCTDALRGVLDALKRSENKSAGVGGAHCAACGAPSEASKAHCAACGEPTAQSLGCPGCERVWTLPVSLLRRDHATRGLHCVGCGARLRPKALRPESPTKQVVP